MFLRENETLYLSTWEYNAALILDELQKIIINNGGRVKQQTRGYIVNRTITELATKCKLDAAKVSERITAGVIETNEAREAYIAARTAEAAELEAIPNAPRAVSTTTYISFVIDNMYYYVQFDENPFFDFYYIKTPVNSRNEYSRDACSENLNKDFLWDCFLSLKKPATDADRREAANMIFNQITSAKDSIIRRDSRRQRVSNTYNSGYHYETIYAKERFAKIDF